MEQVKGAIVGCEIGSEWDDTVENLVDNLLNIVHETVDVESMPKPPVSLTVLEGGTAVTYVPIQHCL